MANRKPIKLDYLSSAALPVQTTQPTQQPRALPTAGETRVSVTSSPSGGEIYVDGRFFGNTPSDITLSVGEHLVQIMSGFKEWSRTIQITPGNVHIHADIAEK